MFGSRGFQQRSIDLDLNVPGKHPAENCLRLLLIDVIDLRSVFLQLLTDQGQQLLDNGALLDHGFEFVVNEVYGVDFRACVEIDDLLRNLACVSVIQFTEKIHVVAGDRSLTAPEEITALPADEIEC